MRIEQEARKLGEVDTAPLLEYLQGRESEVWHFKCDAIRTLPHCTRIILRHSRDYNFDLYDIVDWPHMEAFRPYVQPITDQVCDMVGRTAIAATFIATLPAGTSIYPHVDAGDFLTVPARIHIPLKTNPGVIYRIGGAVNEDPDRMAAHVMAREFHMKVGEVWEIDNTSYHSVTNTGDTDRWHLIYNIW